MQKTGREVGVRASCPTLPRRFEVGVRASCPRCSSSHLLRLLSVSLGCAVGVKTWDKRARKDFFSHSERRLLPLISVSSPTLLGQDISVCARTSRRLRVWGNACRTQTCEMHVGLRRVRPSCTSKHLKTVITSCTSNHLITVFKNE